ncbi:hypothetical protein [Pseudomonas bharatica]|uniref:hypothetical protein n=1 Tax=Pseudomonas bharatica TaxID=2692112 RepID=UPI003B27DA30
MAWAKQGTVAITAGQTTVTGTGTDFAASSRVGDAFIGPDGLIYEVTNIASASVLSILPPYRSATVTAGAYVLVPIPGYPKLLADQVNAIVQQWGLALASLGPLSSVTVAPIANGGTGATTVAGARTALGLGTAATRTIGTSPSNALEYGAFGLGRTFNEGFTRLSDASGSEVFNTGFHRYDVNTVGRPTFGTGYGSIIQLSAFFSGANYGSQIGVDYATSEIGFRALAGSAGYTPWRKIYHDGNTTRAADGTLKAI